MSVGGFCRMSIYWRLFWVSLLKYVDKADDAQSVNTMKNNEDGLFVKRLRSLFPAIEIKIEHVCFHFHLVFILCSFH